MAKGNKIKVVLEGFYDPAVVDGLGPLFDRDVKVSLVALPFPAEREKYGDGEGQIMLDEFS
jgi:hypothetical protein